MAILGSPEFRNFRAIDKELMDNFLILFSDAVYEMNKPEESEVLVRAYAEEYNQRLTLNVMRGYDLMNWLMQLATQADTKSDTKESWIKKKEPFRGINQNFRFENYPDNQAVFILRMEGRTIGKAHEY